MADPAARPAAATPPPSAPAAGIATSAAGRLGHVAAIAAPVAVAGALGVSVCPSALLLRLPCPGCGLTRAMLAFARGDWAGATALQPLALVVCPLFAVALGYAALRYVVTGRVAWAQWKAGPLLVVTMGALTLVWMARWFGWWGGPVPV